MNRAEVFANEEMAKAGYETACRIVENRFFMDAELNVRREGNTVYVPDWFPMKASKSESLSDKKSLKRHPSEITQEEFEHIAKIVSPISFTKRRKWIMSDADILLPDAYKLHARSSVHVFYFSWWSSEGVDISFDDGQDNNPSFQRSLRIKKYLDEIGINCNPKSVTPK